MYDFNDNKIKTSGISNKDKAKNNLHIQNSY